MTLSGLGYSVRATNAVTMGVASGSSSIATGAMGPTAWIFAGFIYTAKTGLEYRRFRKGQISKDEFKTRTKKNTAMMLGGVTGGAGGAALGFAIGTAIMPGVGSLIGTIAGGISGGLAGEKVFVKAYCELDERMQASE
mmetsp:Transcript_30426/g.22177  ORF Transcript_30426/g.22177 Transcript_30426/m.22177 type:complete len:138 (-) Transcript_30426:364-777(-)